MEATNKLQQNNSMKTITYGVLLALVFCWP